MKVQYREWKDWAWDAGEFGVIVELRDEYKNTKGSEYQVFYTRHLKKDGTIYMGGIFWTTPQDVDWTGEIMGCCFASS